MIEAVPLRHPAPSDRQPPIRDPPLHRYAAPIRQAEPKTRQIAIAASGKAELSTFRFFRRSIPPRALAKKRPRSPARTRRNCDQPQSFSAPEVRLLIVLAPGFGCGVCLLSGGGRAALPGGTGAHRLRPRRPCLLSRCWGGSCWSCGCWQGAQPPPAGEERVLPGPVRADLQDALAGVPGQARGNVPDAVASLN
jgi:hypothetical protein